MRRILPLSILVVFVGCSSAVQTTPSTVLEQTQWCRDVAEREGQWSSVGAGAAVVAGSEGVGTIATENDNWRKVLGVGVVLAAALAAYSTTNASSWSDSYKEGRCVEYLAPKPLSAKPVLIVDTDASVPDSEPDVALDAGVPDAAE